MSIEQMRAAIAKVYPGTKWAFKVAKMSDSQVVAIYYSFMQRKILGRSYNA